MGFNHATTIASLVVTLLLLPVLIVLVAVEGGPTCGIISTYWGQNGILEGTLREACATGDYGIINIAYLNQFGGGQEPAYNLTDHCNLCKDRCTCIASDIKYCQRRGIKVMLTIGGYGGSYTLNSSLDAQQVAEYLWNNFLGGQKSLFHWSTGPFGDVVLDGIDFYIREGTVDYWDDLAKYLHEYGRKQGTRRLYLSAFPQCRYPDYYLNKALGTGLFDYVAIQFFENPECQYYECSYAMVGWWANWTQTVNASQLLLGVSASEEVGNGYIWPGSLKSDILPYIKRTAKYKGITVWNRYWDRATNYSATIISDVRPCQCIGVRNSYGWPPFTSII